MHSPSSRAIQPLLSFIQYVPTSISSPLTTSAMVVRCFPLSSWRKKKRQTLCVARQSAFYRNHASVICQHSQSTSIVTHRQQPTPVLYLLNSWRLLSRLIFYYCSMTDCRSLKLPYFCIVFYTHIKKEQYFFFVNELIASFFLIE